MLINYEIKTEEAAKAMVKKYAIRQLLIPAISVAIMETQLMAFLTPCLKCDENTGKQLDQTGPGSLIRAG